MNENIKPQQVHIYIHVFQNIPFHFTIEALLILMHVANNTSNGQMQLQSHAY